MILRLSKADDYKYCNCNLTIMKEHSGTKRMQVEATERIAIILLLLAIVGVGEWGQVFLFPGENAATLHSQSIKLIFQNVVFLERRVKGFSQWVEI